MKTMKNNIISVIQRNEVTKNLENTHLISPRSFATLWMIILAMAATLSSCTRDDIAPAYNDAPLTVTATVPGNVWAVATRVTLALSYSDWTLHYTDYTGAAKTYKFADGGIVSEENDGGYTLTTGSELVWAKVNATKPMHLTALCDNYTFYDTSDDYTLHTSVASATAGTPLTFPAMKPTLARLSVELTFLHNLTTAPTVEDFSISVSAKGAAASYNPMSDGGVWPADGEAATTTFTLYGRTGTGTYTVSGTMLLPQQTMGNTLTVEYGGNTWTLDLSTVSVTGGRDGQKANQLFAGQNLTLNLSASVLSVNTPSDIKIEAFTAADASSYESELDGEAKLPDNDNTNE